MTNTLLIYVNVFVLCTKHHRDKTKYYTSNHKWSTIVVDLRYQHINPIMKCTVMDDRDSRETSHACLFN